MDTLEKEKQIIQWGIANGKSKEETREALVRFRLTGSPSDPNATEPQATRPSFTQEVAESAITRSDRFGDIMERDTGVVEKGVQAFGQGAGLAADVSEGVISRIPGVERAFGAIGTGIQKLSETAPIRKLGELIGGTERVQEAVQLYESDENFRDTVDSVANIARLAGEVQGGVDAIRLAKQGTRAIARTTSEVASTFGESASTALNKVANRIGSSTSEAPANIMNRVARLNPSKLRKFKALSGETPGEYLTRTGNFGAPEEIIKNEAIKFRNSVKSVDDAFASLNGTFQDGALSDALSSLVKKAEKISTENVPAPYLDRAKELLAKLESEGLTMSEINEAKRLFERNVKFGYNKQLNPDVVEMATNIDNALREWQFAKAEELGFTNIKDLNKQTQISRFLLNELGDQLIGQSALNNLSLTDWIIVAGGDPTAVGGLLTKKFFSNKGVQARIAEYLNNAPVEPPITPNIEPR